MRGVDSEGCAEASGENATKWRKTKSRVGGDALIMRLRKQSPVNSGRVTMAELKMR